MRFPIGRERATFHGSKPELESIPKEFMTGPQETVSFVSPRPLMLWPRGKNKRLMTGPREFP